MKKILTLIVPTLLVSNMYIFALQKNEKINNKLVWNLNINERKNLDNEGPDGGEIENKEFFFNYKEYASNLDEFITRYPHFVFNNGDYLNCSVYGDNPTDYLTKIYSTNKIKNVYNYIMIDRLRASYPNAYREWSVCLIAELEAISSNQFVFSIQYSSYSNYAQVAPSYNVSISQINFLTS